MDTDGVPTDSAGIPRSSNLRTALVALLFIYLVYTYVKKRQEDEVYHRNHKSNCGKLLTFR